MPGPNSRPSTYEYKPLDMAAGLQVRQSLQKKYEDTQGQLQEQKILAYDALKDSLFDPNAGPEIRKEFDDIYNTAIDSLQTQEDIPQALDAIRKAQDKLYSDPKVQFYKTMLATEDKRAEWQIANPDGYAPLEKIPYDQLFQMQQEGKANIPDLLSTRVGAPNYFEETKQYLGSIPKIQDLLQSKTHTLTSISTWITDANKAAELDEQSRLAGKETTQHMDAYLAFKDAVYSAVENGNTNGARKEKLMSQFEQNYSGDPREAYYRKLQEIAPAFSRHVQSIEGEGETSSKGTTSEGAYNTSQLNEVKLIANDNIKKVLENKDQYTQSQVEYAEVASEKIRDQVKEVMDSKAFKDKNLDEEITADILIKIANNIPLNDTSDSYKTKIGGLGGSHMDPRTKVAESIANGISEIVEMTEGLSENEIGNLVKGAKKNLGVFGMDAPGVTMFKQTFAALQPGDYHKAREVIKALKESGYADDPNNFRNLVEPITEYKVHFNKSDDKTRANDFLRTSLDPNYISEVQGYDKNGKSTTVPVTSSDISGIVGILKDNVKMDWTDGAKFEERGGNLQVSVSISNAKIKEVLETDANALGNLPGIQTMVEQNPGGSLSLKWNEDVDGYLAQNYLQEDHRKMIKAGKIFNNLPTVPEVNGTPTTDFNSEYKSAMMKINELRGTGLKMAPKYEDQVLNVDPVYMDVYNSSGDPVSEKGFKLYIGETPITINEVYQKNKNNLDTDDVIQLSKNLEALGKNEAAIVDLRNKREKLRKGEMTPGEFRPFIEAALKGFEDSPFSFHNKLRILMHLSE